MNSAMSRANPRDGLGPGRRCPVSAATARPHSSPSFVGRDISGPGRGQNEHGPLHLLVLLLILPVAIAAGEHRQRQQPPPSPAAAGTTPRPSPAPPLPSPCPTLARHPARPFTSPRPPIHLPHQTGPAMILHPHPPPRPARPRFARGPVSPRHLPHHPAVYLKITTSQLMSATAAREASIGSYSNSCYDWRMPEPCPIARISAAHLRPRNRGLMCRRHLSSGKEPSDAAGAKCANEFQSDGAAWRPAEPGSGGKRVSTRRHPAQG